MTKTVCGWPLQTPRVFEALANPDCGWLYRANASGFDAIPGSPIAYWASSAMLKAFNSGKTLDSVSTIKQGMKTADNETFLRFWQEVSFSRTGCRNAGSVDKYDGSIWVPYLKGGDFRKWYGNYDYVVYWKDNGEALKAFKRAVLRNIQFSFRASSAGVLSPVGGWRCAQHRRVLCLKFHEVSNESQSV